MQLGLAFPGIDGCAMHSKGSAACGISVRAAIPAMGEGVQYYAAKIFGMETDSHG